MATSKKPAPRIAGSPTPPASSPAPLPAWLATLRPSATGRIGLPKKIADEVTAELGPLARRFSLPRAFHGAPDRTRWSLQMSVAEHEAADAARVLGVLASRAVPVTDLELWSPPGGVAGTEAGAAAVLSAILGSGPAAAIVKLTLVLTRTPLGTAAIEALASFATSASGLRHLAISSAAGAALTPLFQALPALASLKLHGARMGDAGARALARAPGVATLEHLDLAHHRLGDEGVRALIEAPWTGTVRSLALGWEPELSEAAYAGLADIEAPHLAELSLGNLAQPGARALAAAPFFPRLRALRLRNAGLTDATLARLAAIALPDLEELDVAQNEISAKALDPLVRGAPKLKLLVVPPALKVPATWKKRGRRIE